MDTKRMPVMISSYLFTPFGIIEYFFFLLASARLAPDKLVNVDDAGYGVYQDEEDAKFLFYLPDYRKW